jgi:pyruvate dehydrogenase E2 component (dihydrolipoamide acetyltransferase)
MAERVIMPSLGLTMDEGTILEWLKHEGDSVSKDDALLVVETDKAALEVPSPYAGVLISITAQAGQTVAVGGTIAFVGEPGEAVEGTSAAQSSATAAPAAPQPAAREAAPSVESAVARQFASPRARRVARELGLDALALAGTGPSGRVVERDVRAAASAAPAAPPAERIMASPLARKLADERGMDLASISGTGPGGRITADDVNAALATRVAATAPDASPLSTGSAASGTRREPLGRVRRITAERMAASARTVARVTLTSTVDMAEAVRFQGQLNPEFERRYGARLVYDAMIAKACGLALTDYPTINARWTESDPPAIEIVSDVNVGVAVATDDGLVVVVLKAADARPLHQLSADLLRLADLAKSGRVAPDDVSGGTFTITNLGAYGVEGFTPIINPPEAAILGVGAIARRPAVVGETVVPREQMTLSLSFDHRVNDGAPAAAFLKRVKEILEAPYVLLT